MPKALAYIPELEIDGGTILRKTKVAENLWVVPHNSRIVKKFILDLTSEGHTLDSGGFLLFEGNLSADGTLFEIFQGYTLGLTLFNRKGRATCRAIKNLDTNEIHLFIDEIEMFRFEPYDIIQLQKPQIKNILPFYNRIEAQLTEKDYNPLRNSLEFFTLFMNEKPIRTRILYLMVCLESILVLSTETEGITYKLSMRCAILLDKFYNNVVKTKIFNELKSSYALRSKIIHGGDYFTESNKIIRRRGAGATELDHVFILEPIVKDVLSIIFGNEELYNSATKDELGAKIDAEYLLA